MCGRRPHWARTEPPKISSTPGGTRTFALRANCVRVPTLVGDTVKSPTEVGTLTPPNSDNITPRGSGVVALGVRNHSKISDRNGGLQFLGFTDFSQCTRDKGQQLFERVKFQRLVG